MNIYAIKVSGQWFLAVKCDSSEYGFRRGREVWSEYRTTVFIGFVDELTTENSVLLEGGQQWPVS